MLEKEKANPEMLPFCEDQEILKVAGVLMDGKVHEGEYNEEQTGELMRGFVNELVGKRREDASLRTIKVEIEENKGTITGTIGVKSYSWALFDMRCVLDNDGGSGLLKLSKLEITTKSGLRARAALKIMRVEENTRNDLQKPNVNGAFKEYLNSQLKGAVVTGLALKFNNETLAVRISGKRI